MAKCIYCGRDTCLYVNDDPVCLACSDEIDAGRTPARPHEQPSKTPTTATRATA
jgi:hypothetical protein